MNPLVSVIIPTKNRLPLLKEAIESVLKQDFQDFEIVVVNDGGVDVKEVEQLSSKIRYFVNQQSRGPSAARNVGIKESRGKYIAYLDDDDIYLKDHLRLAVEILKEKNAPIVYVDSFFTFKTFQEGEWRVKQKVPYSINLNLERILIDNNLAPLNFVHQKSCFEKAGFFDEALRTHEDWDLWIRFFEHFQVIHIPKITVEYSLFEKGFNQQSLNKWTGYFLHTMQILHHRYFYLVKNREELQELQMMAREALRRQALHELNQMTDEELTGLEAIFESLYNSCQLNRLEDIKGTRALIYTIMQRLPENEKFLSLYNQITDLVTR